MKTIPYSRQITNQDDVEAVNGVLRSDWAISCITFTLEHPKGGENA
jgi:hypothetical protein